MGPGFLGTRADFVTDFTVVALVVAIVVVGVSIWQVRRGHYARHKTLQLALGIALLAVVAVFEINVRISGGIFEMASDAPLVATTDFTVLLIVHLFFAISTPVLWIIQFVFSLKRFPKPPAPTERSGGHRVLGRLAILDMLATAGTGGAIYVMAFVL